MATKVDISGPVISGARFIVLSFVIAATSGCAVMATHNERVAKTDAKLEPSYLAKSSDSPSSNAGDDGNVIDRRETNEATPPEPYTQLSALPSSEGSTLKTTRYANELSTSPSISLNVEKMPVTDFIHYVMGELLSLDYVIDAEVQKSKQTVTASNAGLISPRQLYNRAAKLIYQRDLLIEVNDGVHYVYQNAPKSKRGDLVVAVGRSEVDVPNVAGDILQVVSLRYGANVSLERTLRELLDLKISLDVAQNALFLQGKRGDILRALDLIQLLDAPANRGKFVGMVQLTFISPDEFTDELSKLMSAEGIPIGVGGKTGNTVALVPLKHIGASAIFASSEELLDRVKYWANILDRPSQGATPQYFMYYPRYARAEDMGASIAMLLGSGRNPAAAGGTGGAGAGQSPGGERTGQAPDSQRSITVTTETLKMVVDGRANSLIFYTSGNEYQRILPLLDQLDVLPKQILLDIVIAEVTLQDEFKFGFEWALQNGEGTLSTLGAFGASNIGGTALSFTGNDGQLISQALQTSQLVNVISNPTILVRDGIQANINVGSDISVVGATTFDPINGQRQTTSSVYRKTGVDVTVTPSVNAENVVVMDVVQTISNAVPDSTGAAGNPDIFERSLNTVVVAGSGQTVLLGGLISEDVSVSGSGTPGVQGVPLLGWFFKTEADAGVRTELVMLITPRILNDLDAWDRLKSEFSQGLRFLQLP